MISLVTGASSGIGLATALELRRAGHTVYGAARRVPKMAALHEAGGHTLAMDARDSADLDRVVDTVLREQGRIDVLVNNAGTVLHGAAEDVPLDLARDQFEVNLFAPARLAQLVLPGMRDHRSGIIVNVSSIGGEIALPLGDRAGRRLRPGRRRTGHPRRRRVRSPLSPLRRRRDCRAAPGAQPNAARPGIRQTGHPGDPLTHSAVAALA